MNGFINIHSHSPGANTILDLYKDFELAVNIPFCSIGLHPQHLRNAHQDLKILRSIAHLKNVVAIGECGLDKLCDTDPSLQETIFRQQIELANCLDKPLIIHCVRAYSECVRLLAAAKVPVIFHGFNRNLRIARTLLDRGFYLSVGAAVFNPAFAAVFTSLPEGQLFFETDDRADLEIGAVYKRAAEHKNIAVESLILQVENNFQKVFNNAR